MKIVLLLSMIFFFHHQAQADFQISTKHAMKLALEEKMMPLEEWILTLNTEGYDLLCLGETHNDYFRELYANNILPILEADVLATETNQEKASLLMEEYLSSDDIELKVTGAPYKLILDSFFNANPEGEVIGVEPSHQQTNEATFAQIQGFEKATLTRPSRDSFIATNISSSLQTPGQRTIALYGSNHCTYFENGLGFDIPFMRFLLDEYGDQKKLLSLYVLKPEEEHLLKIYLKGFGLLKDGTDQVLVDTRSIEPAIYNYRFDLFKILQSYDVIYFPGS